MPKAGDYVICTPVARTAVSARRENIGRRRLGFKAVSTRVGNLVEKWTGRWRRHTEALEAVI